jgi:antitoxin PrlF
MAIAKITSKGQITIPQEVRTSLNLHTGDKIDIQVTENGEAIITPIVKKVDEVFGFLKNNQVQAKTVEEINQGIKTKLKGKFK